MATTLTASRGLSSLGNFYRLTGPNSPVARAVRVQTDQLRMLDVGIGRAVAEQHRTVARIARSGLDQPARALATTIDRRTTRGYPAVGDSIATIIRDRVAVTERLTRPAVPETRLLSDAVASASALAPIAAGDSLRRTSRFTTREAMRLARPRAFDVPTGVAVTTMAENTRLATATLGLTQARRAGSLLNGWQRADLKRAERELLSVRTTAVPLPTLGRAVRRQLAGIRSALAADRALATQAALAASHAALGGRASIGTVTSLAAVMQDVARLSDTSWLTRVAPPSGASWMAPGGLTAPLADPTAPLRDALRGIASPRYPFPSRWAAAAPDRAVGMPRIFAASDVLLDAVDVLDELAADIETRPPMTDEERAIAATMALVAWAHAARAGLQRPGRAMAAGARLVVAQTGAVLGELGTVVGDEVERAADWAWTAPMWPARALHLVSSELTADEKQRLRQSAGELGLAILAAAGAVASGPHFNLGWESYLAWLGAWWKLKSLYADIARLCRDHGREDLVPGEQRWWL